MLGYLEKASTTEFTEVHRGQDRKGVEGLIGHRPEYPRTGKKASTTECTETHRAKKIPLRLEYFFGSQVLVCGR